MSKHTPEALRLADMLMTLFPSRKDGERAAAELRRLHASCEDYAQHKQHQDQRVLALTAQRNALLEALAVVLLEAEHTLLEPTRRKARAALREALPMQEPVGRVVSANCEYATVQWLKQTSDVGGGDPKNSRSWPIAGDAVYTAPPQRLPLTEDEAWLLIEQDYRMEEYGDAAMELIRRTEQVHGIVK